MTQIEAILKLKKLATIDGKIHYHTLSEKYTFYSNGSFVVKIRLYIDFESSLGNIPNHNPFVWDSPNYKEAFKDLEKKIKRLFQESLDPKKSIGKEFDTVLPPLFFGSI